MLRWLSAPCKVLGLILVLVLASTTPLAAMPTTPRPACPPQEQTPEGCAGPITIAPHADGAAYVQPPVAACLVEAWRPNLGPFGEGSVIGHGEVGCSQALTLRMRACVQVSRWYGWQTLACTDDTIVGASMARFPKGFGLSGTYDYRTHVQVWATLGTASGTATVVSTAARYTIP